MVRVCRGAGSWYPAPVMAPEKREFDDVEEKSWPPLSYPDPMLVEFLQMAADLKLQDIQTRFVKLERNLEAHLKASFPNPGYGAES